MGAKRFEELEAWQVSTELKRAVYALIAAPPPSLDRRYCEQIRQSAASAPRNLAEGFGRFRPAVFATFVEIALGSLMETQDALRDGVDRGHFSSEDAAPAEMLAVRSIQLSTKLLQYLKRRARGR